MKGYNNNSNISEWVSESEGNGEGKGDRMIRSIIFQFLLSVCESWSLMNVFPKTKNLSIKGLVHPVNSRKQYFYAEPKYTKYIY